MFLARSADKYVHGRNLSSRNFVVRMSSFLTPEAALRLRLWAGWSVVGQAIEANLSRERFLPEIRKRSLGDSLERPAWAPDPTDAHFSALATEYRKECFNHSRQGGQATHPSPIFFGRAINYSDFIYELHKDSPAEFPTEADVEDLVLKIICKGPMTAMERNAKVRHLPRSTWATWYIEDPVASPFAFARSNDRPLHIRACMGLRPSLADREGLLLLVYKHAVGMVASRPTVADAELYEFFSPPPDGHDHHGMTRPWLPGLTAFIPPNTPTTQPASHPMPSRPFKPEELRPRPEVVHGDEVRVSDLELTLCELI